MIDERQAETAVGELVERSKLGPVRRIERLTGGANNRAYVVRAEDRQLFAKVYFRHRGDPRDRLGAEIGFARFAWAHGVRSLPEPLACDPKHGVALYAFVTGRKLEAAEVNAARVGEALRFVVRINRHRAAPAAAALPAASEACFSIEEHLRCVERRLARLTAIRVDDEVDATARRWLTDKLVPSWESVAAETRDRVRIMPMAADEALQDAHRCLSPSDFGFHNALLDTGGRLVFHDFEYAGWDDPAKLVCDFFRQPERPVPVGLLEDFAASLLAEVKLPEWTRDRIRLLGPVYDVKWCCILLNDFLRVGGERRRFARGDGGRERKRRQLEKAAQNLVNLKRPAKPERPTKLAELAELTAREVH